MKLALIFIPALLLSAYFLGIRDGLRNVPWFQPIYTKLDRFYDVVFLQSRMILLNRLTAIMGYVITVGNDLLPLLYSLMGFGFDIGELIPGGRYLGPILIILGHMNVFLRKDTDGPVAGMEDK